MTSHPGRWWRLLSLLCGFAVSAVAQPETTRSEAPPRTVSFEDVTAEAGIRWRHDNGASSEKYMPETMGAGGLFFDFDADNWIDVFLVDSGSLATRTPPKHALFRNAGNGTFVDVTARSKIRGTGYGMGACAGDYDNDGHMDLYITNLGRNMLYRNDGSGRFEEVTSQAGVDSPLWSTSCAFGDVDNDGDLDLYVANYVNFTVENNKYCGDHVKQIRAYCHPNVYDGLPDVLYRNNGDGTFVDVSRRVGMGGHEGKGLGVVFGDFDRDGWVDIYVSNDSVPNFLYRNLGGGTFEELGLFSGVAVNGEGQREAGMGTDFGDYDNDGWPDLFVTNLDMETNTLYRNLEGQIFTDETFASRLGEPSLRYVGFGTAFGDYDNDGDQDLAVVNGHILDNAHLFRDNIAYEQRNLLFRNDGGDFDEVGEAAGRGFGLVKVSRALSVADYDNDGDLDLLITNNGQTPDLLRNDGGNRGNWLRVRLVGRRSNRHGVGAVLLLQAGSGEQYRQITAGSSYLTQNDARAHFGLGSAQRIQRLEVRWPSGVIDVVEGLEVNRQLTVVEGEGSARSTERPKP